MMQAKKLVNILQRYNPDWTRQALLDVIDYVQRIMVNHPTTFSRAVSTDGEDPEFELSDLVGNTLTIDDAFRIEKVYKDGQCPLDVLIQYNVVTFPTPLPSFPVRVQYYIGSSELTSELIELNVPDTFIDLLEAGCIARIEQMENGTPDSFRVWKQRELRRYWAEANRNFRYKKSPTYSRKLYGE
jgi:hypothetical protein